MRIIILLAAMISIPSYASWSIEDIASQGQGALMACTMEGKVDGTKETIKSLRNISMRSVKTFKDLKRSEALYKAGNLAVYKGEVNCDEVKEYAEILVLMEKDK